MNCLYIKCTQLLGSMNVNIVKILIAPEFIAIMISRAVIFNNNTSGYVGEFFNFCTYSKIINLEIIGEWYTTKSKNLAAIRRQQAK